jgi:hypothetical protein
MTPGEIGHQIQKNLMLKSTLQPITAVTTAQSPEQLANHDTAPATDLCPRHTTKSAAY